MRVVDCVVCCDLDCWDFNSFCLERGVEGLKDHLVVCMSKNIAFANEKSTTQELAKILEVNKENYYIFEQRKTGQLVFVPKVENLSAIETLGHHGMVASKFLQTPLDMDEFIAELTNEENRCQRVDIARHNELKRRATIIQQPVPTQVDSNVLMPDYPLPLEDPFNPFLNQPKAIKALFDIFDPKAPIARNMQLAGHGSNRQSITSFFIPNFHTVLSILKELHVQFLFLDSCCTGGENAEHLYAQQIQPATRNADAWNDLAGGRESVPFPIMISTIGNIFTYGTRSNAKKLFDIVTDNMNLKRQEAIRDQKNTESIPKHITAHEWNDILSQYEKNLEGERKFRHLMQILLPNSKFSLGSVQLLNPNGKFSIINAIEVSKAILKAKFNQPRDKKVLHVRSMPEFSPWDPLSLFRSNSPSVDVSESHIVIPADIKLVSLRITHIPMKVKLESTLEQAPAIFSSVPGVQHHYFEGLVTPNMSLDDCWRAFHSYNQHDDAFRELLTEKAYFFKTLQAKDLSVDNVLMYPIENQEKDSLIKNFDRVCYRKGGQYYVRQLKNTKENFLTQGIPATFRAIYEETKCTELQYMLELLATLVRTKPSMVMRVVAATEESDASFKAIYKLCENSGYASILQDIYKNHSQALSLLPQGLQIFLAKLPAELKKQMVRASTVIGEEEKRAVQDLLRLKETPTPVTMVVGGPRPS